MDPTSKEAAGATDEESAREDVAGLSAEKAMQEGKSPFIVDWDGPEDPANPRNWKFSKRLLHVGFASAFALYSNLASTMFAPGAGQLVQEFQITSSLIAALCVSIYVLGFATGPLLLAPMSELYGRLPCYHLSSAVFVAFTVGCALSTNVTMFLIFRFICGIAGSIPMTIGSGTVADVTPPETRGKYIGIFGIGPLIGPVIGPVIGGFVTESIGWRWTFWLITILSGVATVVMIAFMRETFADVILNRKAERLRKETGNPAYKSPTDKGLTTSQLIIVNIQRPTKMLIFSPLVLFMTLYATFVFGLIFLLFTTFPSVFEGQYHFTTGTSGLSYLGLGFGFVAGLVVFGRTSDKIMLRKRGTPKGVRPEHRLPHMFVSPLMSVGFFWYGWSAQAQTHWIVPILGTFVIGFSTLLIIIPAQIYLVDVFGPQKAASAIAAFNTLRNIGGAFLPLAGPPLYASLGLGWGNSLLAFIGFAFTPIPFLLYRYGEALRKRFPIDF